MVKVTLEFASVDQAIVALGKLAGTAVKANIPVAAATPLVGLATPAPPIPATRSTRKPRADKGQSRGPNAATTQAAVQDAISDVKAGVHLNAPVEGSAVIAPSVDSVRESPAPAASSDAPTPQQLVEAIFNKSAQTAMDLLARFGVKRIRELLPAQHADFIAFAKKVLETGSVEQAAA